MNEKRSVMSALTYAIEYLNKTRKSMIDVGAQDHETSWAIGSLVSILSANLIKIFDDVVRDSIDQEQANAHEDLMEIKKQFNFFLDTLISGK